MIKSVHETLSSDEAYGYLFRKINVCGSGVMGKKFTDGNSTITHPPFNRRVKRQIYLVQGRNKFKNKIHKIICSAFNYILNTKKD